jgi:hypothetical protein
MLEALAQALQLDEAERAYLFGLARAAHTTTPARRRRATRPRVRPSVQRVLDAMTGAPAYVLSGCADVLAANRLGYALLSEMFSGPARPANTARFVFLDPRATSFFVDWDRVANEVVATLRSQAGRDPYDRGLSNLVGELSMRSEAFRTRWAAHNVRHHRTGRKHLHHPVVGDLELIYEVLDLSADPGLSLVVYSAEPGSASQDGLNLLASWSATLDQLDQAETAQAPDEA